MPVVRLTKRVTFAAAHRLFDPRLSAAENARIYGPCANEGGHGHNYALEATVEGRVDPRTGMAVDLKLLKAAIEREVVSAVDHRSLNEDVPFLRGVNPTAENLAVAFWGRIAPAVLPGRLVRIRLYESANSFVDYRGEGEGEPAEPRGPAGTGAAAGPGKAAGERSIS